MKILYIPLTVLFLFTAGCSSSIETFESTQSLGKQLEDLQQAYQSQAISEDEYSRGKEILIDHYK